MVSLRSCLAAVTGLCLLAAVPVSAANTNLTDWLNAQAGIKAWSADFVQTRTLKALVQPLTNYGRLWFSAPSRFRWELGDQTIAVQTTNAIVLIYPELKRAERYPLEIQDNRGLGGMLALLSAGFPRSEEELRSKFRVLSIADREGRTAVLLQPRSSQARRWIGEIEVTYNQDDFSLAATELRFSDGSKLRNEFRGVKVNPPMEASLFSATIDPSYTVVEPLAKPGR